ncbi:hypothetical protein [Natranaeroarchaeum aerophilus]|uniref:Protein kinase domain-containing protein n=1 Tax=Natranaeroarchaeum aerophilus TaxID=2917711 RepID=A0AAE3K6D6_9EURY|nr:hypothetical protein [Natranaeroarchaeum aerophilus]MCL9814826.1 hypothetical protein [Natranaeroarchaeum aerophilus]
MAGTEDGLLEAVPDARSVDHRAESKYIHLYDAVLEDGERWRLLTIAPEITDRAVRTAFTQVAGQWEKHGSHDNCVTVHATGTRPRPWIAVEHLDGEPVTADLTHEEIGTVLEDVADVLQHAGLFYGSFHLALDPEQIWVTRNDEGAIDAVVDNWGLERACRVAAGETPITPYTPPELLDEPDEKSSSADVYGLGGVVYYALTGQPPIDPDDNLAAAIRAGSITPPSEIDPSLPPELDDALATALATDPEDRYESLPALQRGISDGLTAASEAEPADADGDKQPSASGSNTPADSDDEQVGDSDQTDEVAADSTVDAASNKDEQDTEPTPDTVSTESDDGAAGGEHDDGSPDDEDVDGSTGDTGDGVDVGGNSKATDESDSKATDETVTDPDSQSGGDDAAISRRSLVAGVGIGALGVGGLLVLGTSILGGGDEDENGEEAANGDENGQEAANGDEQATLEPAVTFPDQALDGGDVTIEVTAPEDYFVLISYPDGGEEIVAGSDDVSGLDNEEFPVEIEDRGGLPGEHTAHIIANDDGSGIYGPGGEVSGSTAAAAGATDDAEVTE